MLSFLIAPQSWQDVDPVLDQLPRVNRLRRRTALDAKCRDFVTLAPDRTWQPILACWVGRDILERTFLGQDSVRQQPLHEARVGVGQVDAVDSTRRMTISLPQ